MCMLNSTILSPDVKLVPLDSISQLRAGSNWRNQIQLISLNVPFSIFFLPNLKASLSLFRNEFYKTNFKILQTNLFSKSNRLC